MSDLGPKHAIRMGDLKPWHVLRITCLRCWPISDGPRRSLFMHHMEHPDYYNACARWHAELSADQSEAVLVVIDTFTHARREAAEKIADQLPRAPKQPS